MKKLYQNLVQTLMHGQSAVLATVLYNSGSAPRSTGAKMLIYSDGFIYGSVGGGSLEAETMELAKKVLTDRQPLLQEFNLSETNAAGTGMICGGQGEIFVDYIDAGNNDNQKIYTGVLSAMDTAEKAWLITEIKSEPQTGLTRQQCLIKQGGTMIGNFLSDADFLNKMLTGPAKISIHADARENSRFVVEPIKAIDTVYIFGAGHISLEIAVFAEKVGFKTVVIDDRANFANKERFPQSEIIVAADFGHLPELSINKNSYLVIVTRGHLHDAIVLEQVLRTKAAYIGMIGSKRKRDMLYQELQKKGFDLAELNQVHSPIGLDIYAETPAEIAVSIVAELIKVRAEQEKCAQV